MARTFRISGTLENQAVIWFANRSEEPGSYALDGGFNREEASSLGRLLESRDLECRIEEIPGCAVAAQSASRNLLGRLFRLEADDENQLPCPVIGCVIY